MEDYSNFKNKIDEIQNKEEQLRNDYGIRFDVVNASFHTLFGKVQALETKFTIKPTLGRNENQNQLENGDMEEEIQNDLRQINEFGKRKKKEPETFI